MHVLKQQFDIVDKQVTAHKVILSGCLIRHQIVQTSKNSIQIHNLDRHVQLTSNTTWSLATPYTIRRPLANNSHVAGNLCKPYRASSSTKAYTASVGVPQPWLSLLILTYPPSPQWSDLQVARHGRGWWRRELLSRPLIRTMSKEKC